VIAADAVHTRDSAWEPEVMRIEACRAGPRRAPPRRHRPPRSFSQRWALSAADINSRISGVRYDGDVLTATVDLRTSRLGLSTVECIGA
jgi:hypothetical protein